MLLPQELWGATRNCLVQRRRADIDDEWRSEGKKGGWGLGCVANKGLINCGFASVASKGLTSRFCGSVANTGLSDITGGGGGLHGMSEKGHVAARAKQAEQKQPNPKYSRHYTEELRFVTPLIGCPSYAKYRS